MCVCGYTHAANDNIWIIICPITVQFVFSGSGHKAIAQLSSMALFDKPKSIFEDGFKCYYIDNDTLLL